MHIGSRARRVALLASLTAAMATGLLTAAPLASHASTWIEFSHDCAVIGSDGTTQAVHCADLLGTADGYNVGTDFYGQNEVLCQNIATGAIVECAGIHETVEIAIDSPVSGVWGNSGVCGVRFGHSACGARRVENMTTTDVYTGPGFYTCDFWAISANDSVVLPGSGKTVSGGNIATEPHEHVTDCADN